VRKGWENGGRIGGNMVEKHGDFMDGTSGFQQQKHGCFRHKNGIKPAKIRGF
jgi:hypothetical protein